MEQISKRPLIGFVFASNGRMTTGINRLVKQGHKAWFCIQRYLQGCKYINIPKWRNYLIVLVKPILVYACEAWGESTYYNLRYA